jgi:hypothetical protein
MRINGIVPVLALAALAAGALTGCAPKRVDQDPSL